MSAYHRRVRAAAAVAVAAIAATMSVLGLGASATECPGSFTQQEQGWVRIAPPHFDAGNGALAAYAVRPDQPGVVYASNGTAIARSLDGGCSWRGVYALPDLPSLGAPVTATTAHIVALWVPSGYTGVYGVVVDTGRVYVLRGANASEWSLSGVAGAQVDPLGTDPRLLAPTGDLTKLYLVTGATYTTRPATGRVVYQSSDGGGSWAPLDVIAGVAVAGAGKATVLTDFAVDPRNPLAMWAATTSGLYKSTDAGATWADAGIGAGTAIDMVTVGPTREGRIARTAVFAFERADKLVYTSTDEGGTWTATTLPDNADTSAVDTGQPAGVIDTPKGVYQVRLVPSGVTAMWTGSPRLTRVSVDGGALPFVWACSCDGEEPALWRHADPRLASFLDFVPPPVPFVIPGRPDFDYTCHGEIPTVDAPPVREPSTVTPATKVLTLVPGQTVTLPFRLHAAARPLDVYYVAASGSKMEFAICPFETGAIWAANAVQRVRNLRVGMGEYRDYVGEQDDWGTGGALGGGFTYIRRASTTVPGAQLPAALAQMHWSLTPDRAGAVALYQAATGAGQDLAPAGPSVNDIAPGLHADFDGQSYKVVMTVSGSWFNNPKRSPAYKGPAFDKVVAALNSNDVHQVGIWVNNTGNKQTQDNQPFDGREDERLFANRTGAIASAPLDCNDDGYVDVPKGGPLVCDWQASFGGGSYTEYGDVSLGREMAQLLLALRDPEPVRLVATRGAGAVSVVTPAAYPGVNLLHASTHDFQVTFRCGSGQVNTTTPVTLSGVAGPNVVAASNVVVRCGTPLPVPPRRPVAIAPFPVPPVPPIPNPLPNPAPHPGVNPAPNPAPNPAQAPQAQAQPVAQGAVMPQRQAEPQLAFQRASNELQGNEAMSALRPAARDPLRPARRLALLGGVCVVALAGVTQAVFGLGRERSRR